MNLGKRIFGDRGIHTDKLEFLLSRVQVQKPKILCEWERQNVRARCV